MISEEHPQIADAEEQLTLRGGRSIETPMSGSESDPVKKYLKQLGAAGGKAGRGKSKIRGTIAYYKRISRKGVEARRKKAAAAAKAKTKRAAAGES